MILTDQDILNAIAEKEIVIDPFYMECLGTNSYDVHIGKHLAIYEDGILDCKTPNKLHRFEIPEEGLLLLPGELYLGATQEYTETHNFVPILEGKSSLARLGISIHATAGFGDVGFCNHWTLEISVIKPVRIYAGMPIGQLVYHTLLGDVLKNYAQKPSAKYTERNPMPCESRMFKNFVK